MGHVGIRRRHRLHELLATSWPFILGAVGFEMVGPGVMTQMRWSPPKLVGGVRKRTSYAVPQLGWRTRLLHLPDGPLAARRAPPGNGSGWRVAQAVLLVGPRSGSSFSGSVPAETGSKITH